MSEQIWLQSGNTFTKGDATTVSHKDGLPKGIYEVRLSMTGFYLEKIADSFVFNYKLYGLNQDFINYVLKTYNNTTGNLGVLLTGIKGTGKSVVAKELCNYLNLPVIIVKKMNSKTADMINYLSTSINFECIFFFDEYEKEFEESSVILSFMDGVYNSIHRKVFLLTTNSLNVDKNLIGRPSRIRYRKSFDNLPEDVTKEILNDILEDKTFIDKVIDLTHSMQIVTIDLIKAIATDINIHGNIDTIKNVFNIEFSKFSYAFNWIKFKKSRFRSVSSFNKDTINSIVEEFSKYKKLKLDTTSENVDFIDNFNQKFYIDYDSTIEDKELQYLKAGDKFSDCTIMITCPEKKWLFGSDAYGNMTIFCINSCYSCSSRGNLNMIL